MKRLCVFLVSVLFVGINFLQAQTVQVTGTVTSAEDGMPIPGASILVKGTSIGVATNVDGQYTISVPSSATTLVYSFVGMLAQEVEIAGRTVIDVVLSYDAAELEEVVITGYSTSTRRSFTGSATTVTAEKIQSKNVGNISKALAGEVPGVTVINTSGQPGTSATIRIRGIGSVNGNMDPLYVVDGVPYDGSINSINPNDIETTTILKDAAATAIYGARGANGVIVITTKRGSSSKTNIQVEQRYGQNVSFLPRYDRITDPDEYIGLSWEALYNRGAALGEADPAAFADANLLETSIGIGQKYNLWNVADGSELIDPATRTVRPGVTRRYTPENWEEYGFQPSTRAETNLSISGGNQNSTYYTSIGYLNDVGYSINSSYDRLNARVNVTHRPKDWLEGAMNLNYSYANTKNAGQSEDSGSIFWFVDNIPSIYPLYLRDAEGNKIADPYFPGNYVYDYGDGRRFGAMTNSIADATIGKVGQEDHTINSNASLKATIIDGLTVESTFASSFLNRNYHEQNSPFYGPSASSGGSIYRSNDEYLSYNFLQLVRYKKSFDVHNIEVFGAHESNYWEFWRMSAYKSMLANPNGIELGNAIVSSPSNSYKYQYSLESYFGQINYDFNYKYFLSATIRRDGSSRFVKNKWGTFGSVGAAWMITEEEFLKDHNLIKMLKLKASYGILGEQGGVGYYPGLDLYDVNNLDGNLSFVFATKGNPDLTWEKSNMYQVGVEFMLGSFLEGNLAFYTKTTNDLLFDRRVAPSNGYAIIKVNDGQLVNQGLEFDFTAHLIKGSDKYLDFRVNGEFLKNTLIKMPIEPSTGEPKILDIAGRYGRTEGRSLYDYYIRDYMGVDETTGKSLWRAFYVLDEDDNKEYISSLHQWKAENPERVNEIQEEATDVYQNATNHFVGKSALPKLRGGFSLDGAFKDFDFGLRFAYSLGGWAYDFTYAQLMSNDYPGGNNWHKDIHGAWKEEGDKTDIPRLSADHDKNVASTSTRFLISSSYLALNNVRIGYTLPKSVAQAIKMQAVNISVSADNLYLLSGRRGFNPSTSITGGSDWYTYSPLTTFSVAARFNF